MTALTSPSARRRVGSLLAAAVLAGTALTAAPTLAAAERPAEPARTSPAAAAPLADPNADGYDSFIVTYRETAANSTAQGRAKAWGRAAREAGVSVKELRETALGSRVIATDEKLTQEESAAFMADLRASGAVEAVEPNVIMTRAALSPADPYYADQWGFTGVNGMRVPGAWDVSTGTGAIVGVIDTGQTDHADLNANTVPGYDFISDATTARDGGGRDADPRDEGDWYLAGECGQSRASNSSWHGSHVAGTVAAVANTQGVVGVAPGAKVQHARVLGKCGGTLADIADAIVWSSGGSVPGVPANPTPVDVINMSLGGQGTCGTTYQNAINAAVGRGVPMVVAAGNENQSAANARPANCQNTITVAATDVNGNRASYSNYGSAVDVAAPGSGIISTVNAGTTTPTAGAYAQYNGTSMATPHVAGTVALMLAEDATLTPAEVESSLKTNSRPIPGVCAEGCGAGLVDAAKTLASLRGGTTDPDPVTPVPGAEKLVNGGFESGLTGWTATGRVAASSTAGLSATGSLHAALNGKGGTSTATLTQKAVLPAGAAATLSYAVRVDSAETTTARQWDKLTVSVSDGATTTTLRTHSNLDKSRGYLAQAADLSAYAGKTVTISFSGTEDGSGATTFRIDDVSVKAG